jgi:hypothetical protein
LKQEIGEHAAAAAAATAQAHSLQVELQVRDTCRTHRAHICGVLMVLCVCVWRGNNPYLQLPMCTCAAACALDSPWMLACNAAMRSG